MSLLTGLLNQTAVYWGTPDPDGYGGFTYAAPVEITCRWQKTIDNTVTADGETQPVNINVWSATAMVVGGTIFLGTLAQLNSSEEADPEIVTNAYRITQVITEYALDGTVSHYKAVL
jgi:hypothetical protein